MKIKQLGKLSIITGCVIGVSLLFNYANYQRYYRSIFIIQTVDFNILSHILPTKLSLLLTNNNNGEINKVINSNYGLFGMVITDCKTHKKLCPQQKVLFSTKSWYQQYHLEDLMDKHFDILRNPPPLLTEQFYPRISSKETELTGQNNQGEIIGRVYYVRRQFPNFWLTQLAWIKKPFSFQDVKLLYTLTLTILSLIGVLVYFILDRIEINNVLKEEKYKTKILKTENELLRFKNFNNAFEQIIEQDFSSVIANKLQELDSLLKNILLRINSDAQNIIHDIYKAPLLFNSDSIPRYIEQIETNQSEVNLSDDLINLLKNLNQTIVTLKWVVEDLRGISKIQSEPIIIQEQLRMFEQNLPPSIKEWEITFIYADQDLWIECNPWHLKSIVKNALYNSSSAMKKYRRRLKKEKIDFNGKITIECKQEEDYGVIQIDDNGSGIPEDIISFLYETPDRLNQTAGNLKGNGSIIVSAYLSLHKAKVEKQNLSQGARVKFIFSLIKQEA